MYTNAELEFFEIHQIPAKEPIMERTQIWNCGGGTQSAAIAVLIIQGKLPKPNLAVIADTSRERSTTWEYMNEWMAPALADVGVILHRVSKQK